MKQRLFQTATFIILFAASAAAEELPGELDVLKDAYDREIRRLTEPVNRKYDDALRELKIRYTKAGRLDDALAVDKILQERHPEEFEDPLNDSKWKWASGGELTFKADGSATHTRWRAPGTWERQEDGTVILKSGSVHTVKFLEDGTGIVQAVGGGSTTITPIK